MKKVIGLFLLFATIAFLTLQLGSVPLGSLNVSYASNAPRPQSALTFQPQTFTAPPPIDISTNITTRLSRTSIYTMNLKGLALAGDEVKEVKIFPPSGYGLNFSDLFSPGIRLAQFILVGAPIPGDMWVYSTPAITQLDIFWEFGALKLPIGKIIVTLSQRERSITLIIDDPPNAPPITEGLLITKPGLFTNPLVPGPYKWTAQAKGAAPGSAWQTLPGKQTIIITP